MMAATGREEETGMPVLQFPFKYTLPQRRKGAMERNILALHSALAVKHY